MRVIDLNFEHIYTRGNHSLIWGGEYKNSLNKFNSEGTLFNLALSPERKTDEVYNFFIQDDISFFDGSFILTPGFKYGHNDYTDSTYQPSIRGAYFPNDEVTLWAAATRSEAEPSRLAIDGYLNVNDFNAFCSFVPGLTDDPALGCIIPFLEETDTVQSNIIGTYELGYRHKLSDRLIIDNTIFYDDYIREGNDGTDAKYLYGYEFNSKFQALRDWTLDFSYVYHHGRNEKEKPNTAMTSLPKHTILASSYYTLMDNTDFDLSYYFLDKTGGNPSSKVDSYSRVDFRIEHRPMKDLRISVTAQNIFEDEHIESNYDTVRGNSVVERSFIGKVTYEF